MEEGENLKILNLCFGLLALIVIAVIYIIVSPIVIIPDRVPERILYEN